MMTKHSLYLFLFLAVPALLLLSSACSSSRGLSRASEKISSADNLVSRMVRQQVSAEWLDAKARISIEGDDQEGSATASIKMRKDSAIWLSIKKLGFEVARVLITPDSVYILNRLGNEYMVKDLKYIEQQFNLPASLTTIQTLLLGNPLFVNAREWQSESREADYHLVGTGGNMENHFWLSTSGLLLQRMLLRDLAQRREVDISLQDYSPAGKNQHFSYLRRIVLDSREMGKMNLEISFSNVELDVPTAIRFEIPDRYTRVD